MEGHVGQNASVWDAGTIMRITTEFTKRNASLTFGILDIFMESQLMYQEENVHARNLHAVKTIVSVLGQVYHVEKNVNVSIVETVDHILTTIRHIIRALIWIWNQWK